MAQVYSSGAVFLFAQMPATSKLFPNRIIQVGTGESAPDIEHRREFSPVMNDLSGERVPHDMLAELESAFVSVDLTRFNEFAIQALQGVPYRGSLRGQIAITDVGALFLTEELGLTIFLLFGRRGVPAMNNAANGAMPPGYRFLKNCYPVGPEVRRVGTKANKIRLVFHAIPRFTGATGFYLYDHDVTAVANIPIT